MGNRKVRDAAVLCGVVLWISCLCTFGTYGVQLRSVL